MSFDTRVIYYVLSHKQSCWNEKLKEKIYIFNNKHTQRRRKQQITCR